MASPSRWSSVCHDNLHFSTFPYARYDSRGQEGKHKRRDLLDTSQEIRLMEIPYIDEIKLYISSHLLVAG